MAKMFKNMILHLNKLNERNDIYRLDRLESVFKNLVFVENKFTSRVFLRW